ncbi:MAG: acyltransferase [Tidjanibacter sp.]|nr:acyltransferase [Tidjanibacter sp.]MBQ5807021.1 acyltransferase [Tidjanibacter sp.]
MPTIDQIVGIKTDGEFRRTALELFRYQSTHCAPYRLYLQIMGIDPAEVNEVEQIPFLPIEVFKSQKVYCGPEEPEVCFTSSATTGMTPSKHYMASLGDYEVAFTAAYEQFYEGMPIYALLPCYLEREGSSLVYMVDRLIARYGGGFFLDNHAALVEALNNDPRPKILLGVSYALLDLAEEGVRLPANTIVMETGGMKGRRKELSKSELHAVLCNAFGVGEIHSEYGMAELTSQAYSSGGGVFKAPAWLRVVVRDVNNPLGVLSAGQRGGVNIIDLANRYSCAFLQTQDMGRVWPDGTFALEGRISGADIRGCNLLVQK